jgi:hypothetical protein
MFAAVLKLIKAGKPPVAPLGPTQPADAMPTLVAKVCIFG